VIKVLKNIRFSDMNATKDDRNQRFTIYTTENIKESVENTFTLINIDKQPFLSNLLEDLSSDVDLILMLHEYQIRKAMPKKITVQDIDKLTEEEAKRLLMIENRLNYWAQEKYNAKKTGDTTRVTEIANVVSSLNNEMKEIKNTAFSREAQEI
jgi:hypothetical protein